MSDRQNQSLDWSSVFGRAHRRVAIQLAIAAALGAVGAILLFGGGTAAHNAVHEESTPPPPAESGSGPTTTTEGEELVLSADLSEQIEDPEGVGIGTFSVVNDLPTDAEPFTVVATPESTDVPQIVLEAETLPAGEPRSGEFECPAEDTVVVEIQTTQPHSKAVPIACAVTEPVEPPGEEPGGVEPGEEEPGGVEPGGVEPGGEGGPAGEGGGAEEGPE